MITRGDWSRTLCRSQRLQMLKSFIENAVIPSALQIQGYRTQVQRYTDCIPFSFDYYHEVNFTCNKLYKFKTYTLICLEIHIVVVQSLSCGRLFVTPWIAAHQASLSFSISWSLPKLMPIESMMPSNYLILCHPLLFLPSIFPSIRVFSNESALCIRWSKYWSFSISRSSENSGLISFRIWLIDFL